MLQYIKTSMVLEQVMKQDTSHKINIVNFIVTALSKKKKSCL